MVEQQCDGLSTTLAPALDTSHAPLPISNRQFPVRLEIAVTSRKQTPDPSSNRHFWEGLFAILLPSRASALISRKFLTATQPNSKNRTTP
jgi:hypothetical protein